MIAVIQCAGSKQERPLRDVRGTEIEFVALPDNANQFHPDSPIDGKSEYAIFNRHGEKTWRDFVVHYNDYFVKTGSNSQTLCNAVDLYTPKYKSQHEMFASGKWQSPYKQLYESSKVSRTYILSAGWGLVRGDFLLPKYDITFSEKKNIEESRKRKNAQYEFKDFNHLLEDSLAATWDKNESIIFIGTKGHGTNGYLPLFDKLTQCIDNKIVMSDLVIPRIQQQKYKGRTEFVHMPEPYPQKSYTNWQYQCVDFFLYDYCQQ